MRTLSRAAHRRRAGPLSSPTFGPVPTDANGAAFFLLPPGIYTVTEVETGADSEPVAFYSGGQGIDVVNYAGTAQPTATVTPTSTPTHTAKLTATAAGTHKTPDATKDPGPSAVEALDAFMAAERAY